MKKKLLAVLLTVIMVMSTGCQLAQEDQPEAPVTSDRLAGVFITTEHLDLFDMEAYLEDNWNGESEVVVEDASEYQGRIYAKRVNEGDHERYVFEGLDGFLLVEYLVIPEGADESQAYWTSDGGDGLNDIHNAIKTTDNGTEISMEATIYMSSVAEEKVFYTNPVYQTAEGDVYLMAGTGCNFNPEMGGQVTQTMNETRNYTEEDVEMTDSTAVAITVDAVEVPEKVVLIQMDGNHQELTRTEAVPGGMPEELTVEDGCAYILVEEVLADGTVNRSICQSGDDKKYIQIYHDRGDGICIVDMTEVVWEQAIDN